MDAPPSPLAACLALTETLVRGRQLAVAATLRTVGEKHSMLHVDVLILLNHFAQICEGQILEIGPYVGGSTISLALGARASGRQPKRVTSIEPGGELLTHPRLPSADILGDLRRNLVRRGVADLVSIIEAYSGTPETRARLHARFPPGGIGLLFIDADGDAARDLAMCGDLLAPECYLVVDDYCGTSEKTLPTREQIDALSASGRLVPLGVYGWGTWVGRLARAPQTPDPAPS